MAPILDAPSHKHFDLNAEPESEEEEGTYMYNLTINTDLNLSLSSSKGLPLAMSLPATELLSLSMDAEETDILTFHTWPNLGSLSWCQTDELMVCHSGEGEANMCLGKTTRREDDMEAWGTSINLAEPPEGQQVPSVS